MKRTRLLTAIFILPAVYLLTGCYPDKIDYVDEYDLAITRVNEDTDFSVYNTFSVIDTVIHITEDGEDDNNLSRGNDELILAKIRSNMLDMGFTEVENPDSITNRPDLVLAVSATTTDIYYYYNYYPYYWGWYGWGYPGWGYPGWGWGSVGNYTIGTLIIDMWDTAVDEPEEFEVGIPWTGVVDGLLSGSTSSLTQRIGTQIDQLFIQSPYLQL